MSIANGEFEFTPTTFTSIKRKGNKIKIGFRFKQGYDIGDKFIIANYPEWKPRFSDLKKTITDRPSKGGVKMVFKTKAQYNKAKELIKNESIKTKGRKSPAKKKTTTRKRKTAPKKSGRILRGKRKSPSTSATSVSVGTKRRGGDGKLYVCKTYKRGNKRVKRWFKI